jgi:hypothetical protein
MPDGGTRTLLYGGGNSPVRQNCVVEPDQVGLAAIWTADGYICADGEDGFYRVVYEAPPTGFVYGRDGQCGSWVPVLTKWQADCYYAPVTTVPFLEAPADGLNYMRNGLAQTWVAAGSGSGYVTEAPIDGNYYVRQNGQWVVLTSIPDLVTAPIICGTY